MDYQLFICHASEDKEGFVRPLAESLKRHGVRVWYDEHSLGLGDSLRESIDHGLTNSTYGLVVLSAAFFKKRWAQRELNGLVAREMAEGRKIVWPIWLNIDSSTIVQYSPPLADVVGIQHGVDLESTVRAILDRLAWDDPFKIVSGRELIKILDRNGARAEWTLEKTIIVNRAPLHFLETRATADGTIIPVRSSPGVIEHERTEGGVKLVVTKFSPPIMPGMTVTNSITFDAIEMFRFRLAEGSVVPSLPYEFFDVEVELPEPNLPSRIDVYKKVSGRKVALPGLCVNSDRTRFSVRFIKPEVGFQHTLAWTWEVESPRD